MKVEAVIFDFDGVIHNTFELCYKIYKQFYPNSNREVYRSYFDGNLYEKIDNDLNQAVHDKFRELEAQFFKNLKLEREVKQKLEKLNQKYDLYIISSNTVKNLNTYFENSNFVGIFKEMLCVETCKSKVKKFKILFNKYDLTKDSCIFVTDTLGDILEANKVGIKSIACTFGFHTEERLRKGNPFKVASNFKEIRKIIEEIDEKFK